VSLVTIGPIIVGLCAAGALVGLVIARREVLRRRLTKIGGAVTGATAIERHPLIGVWQIDPTDTPAIERWGETTLEFRSDGTLIHTIHGAVKDEVALLTYRILDDNWIETDQPSHPRPERTRYALSPEGLLITFESQTARYRRSV